MTTGILTPLDQLWERVAALEREVALLRRGGCDCETPNWRAAHTPPMLYVCGYCGAVVPYRLLPEKERPK